MTEERAKRLESIYDRELLRRCSGSSSSAGGTGSIEWQEFKEYALAKEAELWSIFHDELDLDGNGHLDAPELALALNKAGIQLTSTTLVEFMSFLTSSPHSQAITFAEFRDFLLLLPIKINTAEIYKYYKVRQFMGDDGRGPARVNMEGDVSLSAEDRPPSSHHHRQDSEEDEYDDGYVDELDDAEADEHEPSRSLLQGHSALQFLLAGGVAGAVSRTCTAPFDRLKVFLITRGPPEAGAQAVASAVKQGGVKAAATVSSGGLRVLGGAIARIYAEGGVMAFWTGNGLSVAKIFPESAIKFYSYETAKRVFAEYWDRVEDPRDISGTSRFVAGGIGGITSQLSIYPIETLKTQMMSNTGEQKKTLVEAIRHLYKLGGVRAYYRGLTIGLIGVFPYSAIDMSTFEGLKLAYVRSLGSSSDPDAPPPDPGVLALLLCGSISGSVGATSVYPLNLVRTRLQASGSSGHPQRYTGVWDVCLKTFERDGWRGFYRGLFPTLAKVVPSVSISYVVYEHTKRKLGV